MPLNSNRGEEMISSLASHSEECLSRSVNRSDFEAKKEITLCRVFIFLKCDPVRYG